MRMGATLAVAWAIYGPHIRHAAGHEDAVEAGQLPHFGAWAAADNMELGSWQRAPNQRQDVGGKPDDSVSIWRVVHRAGEDIVRPGDVIDRGMVQGRVEIVVIDTVADAADAAGAIGVLAGEQGRFGIGDERCKIARAGDPLFQAGDLPPLSPIDKAHGAVRCFSERVPFLGIHIHQIHHPLAGGRQVEDVRRHVR